LAQRLNSKSARDANYEMILQIYNDCLQGSVKGLGVVFAGTDIFMDDRRRGLMSYEAFSTRLANNTFAVDGLRDYSNPVIRLQNLTVEDLYALLHNIRQVYASGDVSRYLVPDEALKAFIQHCVQTLGAEFYQTPRDAAKGFVGFLSVLEQNPGTDWKKLLSGTKIQPSINPESLAIADNDNQVPSNDEQDELATFRI